MARHKDTNWNLGTPPGIDGAAVAVLMDIRDELKALNAALACPRFLGIPTTLQTISRKIPARTRRRPRAS